MSSTLRRVLATALLTGLVATPVGAASAQSLLDTDQRADVRSFSGDSQTPVAEPAVTNGDVLATRFTHGKYRVGVRIQLADLQKTGAYRAEYVRIVTNEGLRREVTLTAVPGLWRGRAEMDRPSGRKVRCAVRHDIDYAHDVVTIDFPRTCISGPRWVRLGVGSLWGENQKKVYVDDARIDGTVNPDTVRLSPRLKRG
jgi:hypothetical protein